MKVVRRLSVFVSLAVIGVLVAATPAFAQSGRPGNNGTVKIDGTPFDTHPNNEPHVGCVFQVDFYGYDQGDLDATATFSLHPPTGTSVLVTETAFIGGDGPGGGTDLDAELTVDLQQALIASGATPHPQQGFHVKLTVHAEGSIGSDVKHKVFWVQCEGVYPPVVRDAGGAQGTDMEASATQIQDGWRAADARAMAVATVSLIVLLTASLVARRWIGTRRAA